MMLDRKEIYKEFMICLSNKIDEYYEAGESPSGEDIYYDALDCLKEVLELTDEEIRKIEEELESEEVEEK